MSELAARVLAIGARAKAAQPTRDENRARYPGFAELVDGLRRDLPVVEYPHKVVRVEYLDTGKRWP